MRRAAARPCSVVVHACPPLGPSSKQTFGLIFFSLDFSSSCFLLDLFGPAPVRRTVAICGRGAQPSTRGRTVDEYFIPSRRTELGGRFPFLTPSSRLPQCAKFGLVSS
ncbi:hypothetical protein PAHAL_2G210100 [Panicum hallii]|uniref:Uncharacterized protein n=1 Tax=Panicum hallii TaxID=206008 RepID=A0A2T8KPS9_9POAL|nr:hypothetical protein PAHAL_2G210100 [Panicum hallii]